MTTSPFKKVRKAVFPVAGLGTRFLPATKVMPKEMLILGDRPLIQHAVEEARAAGIEEFVFVSSAGKKIMEDHFADHAELNRTLESRGKTDLLAAVAQSTLPKDALHIVLQEKPLGLGHAVWCARDFVGDEPFAIILPDDVVLNGGKGCLAQMVARYQTTGGNLVAVENVPRDQTSRYGILDIESENGDMVAVKGLVEKPAPEKAPSTLSIIGRYILQPEIMDYLSAFETGAGGEIQLTDSMARLIGQQPFHGLRFAGQRYDCGHAQGLLQASVAHALSGPQAEYTRHMLENMLRRV